MARLIFEGFNSIDEAREFGRKVLNEVGGYTYLPGPSTYDGDLMCEVKRKAFDAGQMTLTEDQ